MKKNFFPGTSGKSETNEAFFQMAVYIANTFFYTSHSIVPVTRDRDVLNLMRPYATTT